MQEVRVGAKRIALTHLDGTFGAISGVCNHVGGPLGQGQLDGDYVVCPWHYWKFHWQTGAGEPGYEADRVPSHAVKVEGGRVLVVRGGGDEARPAAARAAPARARAAAREPGPCACSASRRRR